MRIVYVIGARPNVVKMAPVIGELRKRLPEGHHTLVHTGQHYDPLMSQVFLDELDMPNPAIPSTWARAVTQSRRPA